MLNVGTVHRILAYIAAAVALVSVILAIISKFIEQTIVITQSSYMDFAIVAIIFAIYFLVEGAVYAAKKG